MATLDRVVVNRRALVKRINRQLLGERLEGRPGHHYRLMDTERQRVLETDVNLETIGRELGVLAPSERLEE
jgi:hypothetical protein